MKQHTPSRCTCMSNADSLSTHRAARHDGRCQHSELTRTVKRYQRTAFRRIPGTRGLTPVLDGGR
jgi:hypothetical protein